MSGIYSDLIYWASTVRSSYDEPRPITRVHPTHAAAEEAARELYEQVRDAYPDLISWDDVLEQRSKVSGDSGEWHMVVCPGTRGATRIDVWAVKVARYP